MISSLHLQMLPDCCCIFYDLFSKMWSRRFSITNRLFGKSTPLKSLKVHCSCFMTAFYIPVLKFSLIRIVVSNIHNM